MIKLLKNFTKKEWIMIFIIFIFIFTQVWLELKMPDYMAKITTLVETEGSSMNEILKNGFYMLSCAFGSLVSAIIVGYIVIICIVFNILIFLFCWNFCAFFMIDLR